MAFREAAVIAQGQGGGGGEGERGRRGGEGKLNLFTKSSRPS